MNQTSPTPDIRLISYLSVHRAIGILGLLLPFIMMLGGGLANIPPRQSISDYYYTNMGSVFSGILCAVATFLFTYKGYDNDKRLLSILTDNSVTNVAAICAVLVAFFPCGEIYTPIASNLGITQQTVNTIHYASAGTLFAFLGIMSFFFFTATANQTDPSQASVPMTPEKKTRNKIYRTCGLVMWITVVSIPVGRVLLCIPYYTLIGEAICLLTFGFSWIIKGKTFFKDAV